MARPSPYTEAQKAAILEAVKTARKTGTWPDALKAAEGAGFKGGLQYLMKFVGGGSKRRKAKAVTKAAPAAKAAPKAGKKLGRPKGSKNAIKHGPGRPKASVSVKGAGLGAIDSIVSKMVEQRVAVAISKAVASLEHAAKALKSI